MDFCLVLPEVRQFIKDTKPKMPDSRDVRGKSLEAPAELTFSVGCARSSNYLPIRRIPCANRWLAGEAHEK